jgi:hypothetical protein
MFSLIVGLAALIVAGCAAFFSVQGLATLYAGQFISVCVMAGGLEFGKLVAASYLHRYWNQTTLLLKTYLIIAIMILMSITSLGIFGFLTAAFQQSHVKVEMLDSKQEILESTKQATVLEIENLNKRIETLNQARLSQEKRLPELSKKIATIVYEDIKKSGEEIKNIQQRAQSLSEELKQTNDTLVILKKEESESTDIGTLKFVAQTFGVTIETIVKWFTLTIVLVFDPLAVSLVLAYSNLIEKKENKTNINKKREYTVEEDNNMKKRIEGTINYRN